MSIDRLQLHPWQLALAVGSSGVAIGAGVGYLAGVQPLLIAAGFVAVAIVIGFCLQFEYAVLGLLITRSCLDIFSAYQLPAMFAIGMIGLTILRLILLKLNHEPIKTDRFWWFFAGWVMLQGLWVVLIKLGGLGLGPAYFSESLREWLRLFSLVMIYLLVTQLRDRLRPQQVIKILFLSTGLPLGAALLQLLLPASMLPSVLVFDSSGQFEVGSRINGTLGHPATFATFTLFFLGLSIWQLGHTRHRGRWLLLLGALAFCLVSTKSLGGLAMLLALAVVLTISKMRNLPIAIGGLLLAALVIGLFASSEFGRERLASVSDTPLLNPNMDVSRSVLLSWSDRNSFNWRLAQWTYMLRAWQNAPIWGNGLSTAGSLTPLQNLAHNDYVRALAEQGIVGLGAFLSFLAAQLLYLVHHFRTSPPSHPRRQLCLILVAVLLGMMLGMCTENIWSHTTLACYWWTCMALLSWDWQPPPDSDPPIDPPIDPSSHRRTARMTLYPTLKR